MQVLSGPVATFAVAAIYAIWRTYYLVLARHQRTLRERVAYMLWVAATRPN